MLYKFVQYSSFELLHIDYWYSGRSEPRWVNVCDWLIVRDGAVLRKTAIGWLTFHFLALAVWHRRLVSYFSVFFLHLPVHVCLMFVSCPGRFGILVVPYWVYWGHCRCRNAQDKTQTNRQVSGEKEEKDWRFDSYLDFKLSKRPS